MMELVNVINGKSEALMEKMREIRRNIHMTPELATEEFKTSAYIADELEKIGLDVKKGVASTGVVANLSGGIGKTIAIRADIDALPIREENDVEYKSRVDGHMHACGHDGHIAMALGAAAILKDLRKELNGNVKFVFQPAEEQFGGAERMIQDGALNNPDVDSIIALHLWPDLKKGSICFKDGCCMASNDKVVIKIKGRGGHGAMPHLCIDALTIGCQVINAVQVFLSREINPLDSAVITFGSFNSGTTYNIVSNETVLSGTVRAINEETRGKIEFRLKEIVQGICLAYGAEFEFEYIKQYPVTLNDPDLNILFRKAAINAAGDENVVLLDKPYMAAEDFAYYLHKVPGCLFFLGTGDEKYKYPLHHARFNFDENVMKRGAAFLAASAVYFLNQQRRNA